MLGWVAVSVSVIVCRDPLEGRDVALMSVWSVSVCSANNVSKHVYMYLVSYPVTLSGWTSRNCIAGWRSMKQCITLGRKRRASQVCLVNPTPQALLLLPFAVAAHPHAPKGSSLCFQTAVTFWEPWAPTIVQRTLRMQLLWGSTTAPFYYLIAPKVRPFRLLCCVRGFIFLVLVFSKWHTHIPHEI